MQNRPALSVVATRPRSAIATCAPAVLPRASRTTPAPHLVLGGRRKRVLGHRRLRRRRGVVQRRRLPTLRGRARRRWRRGVRGLPLARVGARLAHRLVERRRAGLLLVLLVRGLQTSAAASASSPSRLPWVRPTASAPPAARQSREQRPSGPEPPRRSARAALRPCATARTALCRRRPRADAERARRSSRRSDSFAPVPGPRGIPRPARPGRPTPAASSAPRRDRSACPRSTRSAPATRGRLDRQRRLLAATDQLGAPQVVDVPLARGDEHETRGRDHGSDAPRPRHAARREPVPEAAVWFARDLPRPRHGLERGDLGLGRRDACALEHAIGERREVRLAGIVRERDRRRSSCDASDASSTRQRTHAARWRSTTASARGSSAPSR